MMIDDIKKVLALCVDSICDDCPYADTKDCYNQIKLDARELIIKQESEIEQLHQEVRDTDKMARHIIEQYKNGYNKAFERLKAQEQEIAELKAAKNDWKQRYESLDQRYMALVASSVECVDKKVKKAKTDVLNELKKYSYCDNDFMDGKWHRYVFVSDIDVLLEKYANENHRY